MIRVLEELEEYALRYESERDEEHSLGRMVDKLDAEKRARAEERLRYERVHSLFYFDLFCFVMLIIQ